MRIEEPLARHGYPQNLRCWCAGLVLLPLVILLGGCTALNAKIAGAVVTTTIAGGRTPTHELQQTYYLGVFDPQDQIPPTIYRVRVHGQASFLSRKNFASGWVPADVVDSLATHMTFDKNSGGVKIEKANDQFAPFKTGRRLMLFGPEGFREAPANHRLVILMASSPETFFESVDQSLGILAQATQGSSDGELDKLLFQAITGTRNERMQLEDVAESVKSNDGGLK